MAEQCVPTTQYYKIQSALNTIIPTYIFNVKLATLRLLELLLRVFQNSINTVIDFELMGLMRKQCRTLRSL